MNNHLFTRISSFLVVITFAFFSLAGCANMNNTQKGAAVGVGTGAVVGGVIGKVTGNTAKGAIIGAVVGGAAGVVIGREMDKQARELENELENAEIERVGEGIQITFDSGILFDFNSANLRPEARQNLQKLAQSLEEYENSDLLVVGHTDARGTDEYNQQLSERRAQAASNYLRELGVTRDRITTLGKGETEPVATNDSDSGRQQNRRVEVAIFASKEYRQDVQRKNPGQ